MKTRNRTFLLLCTLLITPFTVQAQDAWPRTFFVGSNHVRCDFDTTNLRGWPHYIQAVDSATVGFQGWYPFRILPESRFEQLQDLGLNLAEITIDPDSLLTPAVPPRNVVSELNARAAERARTHAGAPALEYVIQDFQLTGTAAAND
jgi:hypothetical protein